MSKVSSSLSFVKQSSATGGRDTGEAHWVPNTDVYLAEGGLVIKVELSGMKREDLELTVDGNRLRIAGVRLDGCRANKCNFILMEISYGHFENVIDLPRGYDLSLARAAYQNGFLRIDVPEGKKPAPK